MFRRMQVVSDMSNPSVASQPLLECTLKTIKLRQVKQVVKSFPLHIEATEALLGGHNPDHIILWAVSCTCFLRFLWSGEPTLPSLWIAHQGELWSRCASRSQKLLKNRQCAMLSGSCSSLFSCEGKVSRSFF